MTRGAIRRIYRVVVVGRALPIGQPKGRRGPRRPKDGRGRKRIKRGHIRDISPIGVGARQEVRLRGGAAHSGGRLKSRVLSCVCA